MKKIIALLLCLICIGAVFGACTDGNNENKSDPDSSASTSVNSFIGDGFKETLSLLVESNRMFVEEVFIERTLTVNSESPVKDGLTTYYPVISETITSYSSLVSRVKATYTEETANELLKDGTYKEINGKLYCKNDHILKHEKTQTREIEIEGVSVTSDKCVFRTVSESGKKIEMTAVFDNGIWKLDKIYKEI